MSDLISRIDVLKLAKDVTLENGCKHRCIDATQINELPSSDGGWIPFRQELNPETGRWEWVEPMPPVEKEIWVTIRGEEFDFVQADCAYKDGYGWWLDSGYIIGDEAIAWMPTPEPYKGG